jgi:hypothetical protein
MGWIYIREYGYDSAYPVVKAGILAFNERNKANITHGFNETITQFFLHVLSLAMANDAKRSKPAEDFEEFLGRYPQLDSFAIVFDYYSKAYLYSDVAKERYILVT